MEISGITNVNFGSRPTMLVTWPDAGDVAFLSSGALRKGLCTEELADIVSESEDEAHILVVDRGLVRHERRVLGKFYYSRNPDLIVFEGTQVDDADEKLEITQLIIETAIEYHVSCVVMMRGEPAPVAVKTDFPTVVSVAGTPRAQRLLRRSDAVPMKEGSVGGNEAALLSTAGVYDVNAACLIVPVPDGVEGKSYPLGAVSLVRAFSGMLGITIDVAELGAEALMWTALQDVPDSSLVPTLIFGECDTPFESDAEKEVPESARTRIEALFLSADRDREWALELKSELDRWGVFCEYEDRFLDLFAERKTTVLTGDDL
jgi:predicted ATP-grasp superfamily ATP-dependent carboligase